MSDIRHWPQLNSFFEDCFHRRVPFLFLVDFEGESPRAWTLTEAFREGIRLDFKGILSGPENPARKGKPSMQICNNADHRIRYGRAFRIVQGHLKRGDSFLTNLTQRTPVVLEGSLEDAYDYGQAPYRLYVPGQFTVFSPELFFRIEQDRIYSRPMKGTIDARLTDARERLMSSPKEQYEHHTIVDLIRNDLSRVANGVRVNRFRYIEQLDTSRGPILQSSSEITGILPHGWKSDFASLLQALLPAGSVSGAPKDRTAAIIREAEGRPRGYYTGVFGIFDGSNVECAVAIRFLEQEQEAFYYRSGGGITHLSEEEEEYRELLAKIYLPIV